MGLFELEDSGVWYDGTYISFGDLCRMHYQAMAAKEEAMEYEGRKIPQRHLSAMYWGMVKRSRPKKKGKKC